MMNPRNHVKHIGYSIILLLVISGLLPIFGILGGSLLNSNGSILDSSQCNLEQSTRFAVVAYEIHSPILIDGDEEFNSTADTEGWLGNGTETNPYIIENLHIDVGGGSTHCFEIMNTRSYFIIRNCLVGNTTGHGMRLLNVTYGEILHNNCTSCASGIFVRSSFGNYIFNNTCTDNQYGINVNNLSELNTISNNNCSANTIYGIFVNGQANFNIVTDNTCIGNIASGIHVYDRSNYNTLANNTCTGNNRGVGVEDQSNHNTIFNNTLTENNRDGIYIYWVCENNTIIKNNCSSNLRHGNYVRYHSTNNKLVNNICNGNSENGILIYDNSNYNNITNNTCNLNGFDGIYLYDNAGYNNVTVNICCENTRRGISIDDFSTGNTIDNNTCSGNTIQGIFINELSDSNVIVNNTCTENWRGIVLEDWSDYNTLVNNNCSGNSGHGIFIYQYCENTTIVLNDCSDNQGSGINIRLGDDGNIISNNTCNSNLDYGIYVHNRADYNVIANNTCNGNTIHGIYVFDDSARNEIINNICNSNSESGIQIDDARRSSVTNNSCVDNLITGIYTTSSSSANNITWNVFINNIGITGQDDGVTNTFAYNYWSDYTGTDSNEDGIGDTPYAISGSTLNNDSSPLMLPPGSAIVWLENPSNQFWNEDSMSYDLNATASPPGVDTWWLNDTGHFSIDMNGVITNTTTIYDGPYYLQVWVNDTLGNQLTSIITITVDMAAAWVEPPENQVSEYGTAFSYDLNITNIPAVDTWWLNDTIHFVIDSEGVITNTTELTVSSYILKVHANSTTGEEIFAIFTITVVDTTSPSWIETPSDLMVEYGEMYICDWNATDLSGIGLWSVNDTSRFSIDSEGILELVGSLEPGIYGLLVSVRDPYNNWLSEEFMVTIQDTTAPDWITIISDQTIESGELFFYQLEAYDLSGVSQWVINATLIFSIDSTGQIQNIVLLNPGRYGIHVSVIDPYGNERSAEFTVIVEEAGATTTTTTITTTDTTSGTTEPPPDLGDTILLIALGGAIAVIAVLVILLWRSKK